MYLNHITHSIKRSILSCDCSEDLADHYWALADLLIEEGSLEAANRAQLVSLKLKPERIDRTAFRHIIDARRLAGRNNDVDKFQKLSHSLDK